MNPPTHPILRARQSGLIDKVWFNALWFQTTWFFCVLGREALLPASLAMIALHFVLAPSARTEATKLAPIVAIGIGVDALLSATGVFDFGDTLIPLWLCLLWIAFATTLNRALAVFGRHRGLAILIGGIGVPFNYAAGAKLGAVSLPLAPVTTAAILILVWAVLLPSLYRISAGTTPREAG